MSKRLNIPFYTYPTNLKLQIYDTIANKSNVVLNYKKIICYFDPL